jgi:DNA-binding response OmpR family regulator
MKKDHKKDVTYEESMSGENKANEGSMQETILIVEDNSALRELLISCLQLAHYSYSVVEGDCNNPLAWIEDSKCLLPDGIIFDVDSRMGGFKGLLDFFHAFCTQWKAFSTSPQMPPLVLLTTHPDRYDELQREGYAVIMKPFKVPVLLSTVKTVLREEKNMV